MIESNVLVIPDTHIPFEHKDILKFCAKIQERCKCGTVVHIGDLVDNNSISYWEHDPDGKSPEDEMQEADRHLQKWFQQFPKLIITKGNHDRLVDRKGKTCGLPERCFKPFREIWELPDGWVDDFEFQFHGVRYFHGTGYSGKYAHVQAAYDSRQSAVIGHTHSTGAVNYTANSQEVIFGMNVGSGIDRQAYAFSYGKAFKRKPILGCGVVTDKGKFAQFFPMDIS